MLKRTFDIIMALLALIILSPVFIVVSIAIIIDSKGGIIYSQKRVGRFGREFNLLKFRTMVADADKKGLLTVGVKDSRITKTGYFLRKNKLDEIPQLINIIMGDMSVVGPRPEVMKYVKLYNEEQKKVLNVRPGLSDLASLEYINENEVLARYPNPEQAYIEIIMPHKLQLNLDYIRHQSMALDLKIILRTLSKLAS